MKASTATRQNELRRAAKDYLTGKITAEQLEARGHDYGPDYLRATRALARRPNQLKRSLGLYFKRAKASP